MSIAEGDPGYYDPANETWAEAKPRLLASKIWRCALPDWIDLATTDKTATPLWPCVRGAREPTQQELDDNASQTVIGQILCIADNGIGKVTEFLNNGSWGKKSGHMVEFGDPFSTRGEFLNFCA